jgi:hypothetical protein
MREAAMGGCILIKGPFHGIAGALRRMAAGH